MPTLHPQMRSPIGAQEVVPPPTALATSPASGSDATPQISAGRHSVIPGATMIAQTHETMSTRRVTAESSLTLSNAHYVAFCLARQRSLARPPVGGYRA